MRLPRFSKKVLGEQPLSCTICKHYIRTDGEKKMSVFGIEYTDQKYHCGLNKMELRDPPMSGWDPSPYKCPLGNEGKK